MLGSKPFPCKLCEKRFSDKRNLVRHLTRLHPSDSDRLLTVLRHGRRYCPRVRSSKRVNKLPQSDPFSLRGDRADSTRSSIKVIVIFFCIFRKLFETNRLTKKKDRRTRAARSHAGVGCSPTRERVFPLYKGRKTSRFAQNPTPLFKPFFCWSPRENAGAVPRRRGVGVYAMLTAERSPSGISVVRPPSFWRDILLLNERKTRSGRNGRARP